MKKTITLILAILLFFSLGSPATLANDLTGHKYASEMKRLIDLGVLEGDGQGNYAPDRIITRAEFAKMVVTAFDLTSTESSTPVVPFSDVPESYWGYPYINAAAAAGVVLGDGKGSFKPREPITRQQMSSMIARALQAKGNTLTVKETPQLAFVDRHDIASYHLDDVRILSHLKIMEGNTANQFTPKNQSTRWMVALVILRSLGVLNTDNAKFVVGSATQGGTSGLREYTTFNSAKAYAQSTQSIQVIEQGNQIVWMKSGIVVANSLANVFHTSTFSWQNGQYRPYVSTGTEMKYLDSTADYVKVEIAGREGYVKHAEVRLIPSAMMTGQSYYRVNNGNLEHLIYNHATMAYASTGAIGKAPAGMVANERYYSWNGSVFTNSNGQKVTESHQYFTMLPLHTKTNYTAAELDKYLTDNFPFYGRTINGKVMNQSPLAGSGAHFIEMQNKYNVNALYLMAHAIHESGWGTSKIAQDKKNLFGYGAVDANPYNGAFTYSSFKESIEDAANRVNGNYQTISGSFYNGSFLGNKFAGMNVRYASDPYWGEKISGHMYRADTYLNRKDFVKNTLAITTEPSLNFRNAASTSGAILYTLPRAGVPVILQGQTAVNGATWFTVKSEDKRYNSAFVYGKGSLGEFVRPLPIAQ